MVSFLVFLISSFVLGLLWNKIPAKLRTVMVAGLCLALAVLYFVFRKL